MRRLLALKSDGLPDEGRLLRSDAGCENRAEPTVMVAQHDPLMACGSARVWARSHAQGCREGHARSRTEFVAAAFRARGIEVALDFAANRALFGGLSDDTLMAAALASVDEADFRWRVRLTP